MNIDAFSNKLKEAFPSADRPHLSLFDALKRDNWGESQNTQEIWSDWRQIPPWALDKCECFFDYFSADEIKCYLPAYLLYAFDILLEKREDLPNGVDSLVMHLAWWSKDNFLYLDLSRSQREIVIGIVEMIKSHDQAGALFLQELNSGNQPQ